MVAAAIERRPQLQICRSRRGLFDVTKQWREPADRLERLQSMDRLNEFNCNL
jgi:hypothetical protein